MRRGAAAVVLSPPGTTGQHPGEGAGAGGHSHSCNHRPYPEVPNRMHTKLGCGAEMASETCGEACA
ncbi:hypothetical protein GCM10010515_05860 [Streptomyces fructofermentans]|uniref:Uncharacterized protein n=1 Tax=Streptomyces fructofermentans TaxID=152141 RepID=A0A918K1G2_9ACTN|nr:hypothetical protein GCM10010515_05860 [Streptomyces fructofermentans]